MANSGYLSTLVSQLAGLPKKEFRAMTLMQVPRCGVLGPRSLASEPESDWLELGSTSCVFVPSSYNALLSSNGQRDTLPLISFR